MLLKDKTVLVTGGSRGIGRAIVETCMAQGARVVSLSRSESAAPAGASLENYLAVTADVTDADSLASTISAVRENFGELDLVVTSAGSLVMAPFLDMYPQDFERDMAVNFGGVVNTMRAVLPGMLKRGAGKIINIASGAGERGWGGASAYAASKAAVAVFSKSLAEECKGKGVSVNVISPAMVDTGLLRGIVGDEFIESNAANIFTPQEIANTVLFLASDLSGRLNGQVFSYRNSARW